MFSFFYGQLMLINPTRSFRVVTTFYYTIWSISKIFRSHSQHSGVSLPLNRRHLLPLILRTFSFSSSSSYSLVFWAMTFTYLRLQRNKHQISAHQSTRVNSLRGYERSAAPRCETAATTTKSHEWVPPNRVSQPSPSACLHGYNQH